NVGILSGFSGLESTPSPDLPRLEFLEKWNAYHPDNQKKYAELDNRFKKSKVLQDLLEKSKKNKE
ncbi:hypothetical protein ACJX0J_005867, partial [Zea mays]